MAEKKKRLGSVKRFGARYGRRVKHKLAEIEAVQRGKHVCPYCRAPRVKRLAVGIWNCRKCGAKFSGKAYSIKKTVIKREEKEE
ncbi:50S ribosomal protein L37ae [Candidatus Woesearchaeota archaeon]|nr:50S ribosomal protein L37ae [Candidatus Woesearchaeota archaeon]